MMRPSLVLLSFLFYTTTTTHAFVVVVHPQRPKRHASGGALLLARTTKQKSPPSIVTDDDGPTPDEQLYSVETVDNAQIPELYYDVNAHPIPHQPWRRGSTEGCEDSLESEWRITAQETIKKAAKLVGGNILDITWYLTQCIITVDHTSLDQVEEYTMGPEIVTLQDDNGPEYFDPDDPNPEPLWEDEEEEYLYERNVEAEQQFTESLYARKEDDDDDDDVERELEQDRMEPPLRMTRETREDMAALSDEEEARIENMERQVTSDVLEVNTQALSTIARSILEALEIVEDDLRILERHEIILAEPHDLDYVLETQSEFDRHRGESVTVETQDPFGSNRTLKGKLIDRNQMDVMINKKGRMVTIPLNFVRCVKLTNRMMEEEDYEYVEEEEGLVEEEEEEEEEGLVEEEEV